MNDDFYRIRRLPPYVFAEVNAMKAAARGSHVALCERSLMHLTGVVQRRS